MPISPAARSTISSALRLSPVLWRKLPGARSAGRVQSVALRLVCDRELEIEKFVAREYWSLVAMLATPRNETFEARLVGADGQKITRLDIGSGKEAEDFKRALETAAFTVNSVEAKPARRNPYPPFMTSTLQQEASRKFGFAPAHTMRIAQRLYEGIDIGGETVGLITYMRTDGVDIAPEAIAAARRVIEADYGARYVPSSPRQYVSKSKNAQEAHEAIRPTDLACRPHEIKKLLEPDQARLYELIWLRTIASQMESAELERTTVDIAAKVGSRTLDLRATGTVVKFDGFLTLYTEDQDDKGDDEDANRLPEMATGDALQRRSIDATQHFTEPPPRYSEASLVKRMEELGIGRPSTYASILQVLRDRGYVRLDKKRLVPEDKGRVLTAFLENFFARYVEYDFTANLEEQLDMISNNELPYKDVLRDFWRDFIGAVGEIKDFAHLAGDRRARRHAGAAPLPAEHDGTDPRKCPNCENGRIGLKLGRFGGFVGCSNYPECRFTRQLTAGPDGNGGGMRKLGEDPDTGLEVTVRSGRFGSYLQLGEATKDEDGKAVKPKRASLPKGVSPEDMDLERALKLLALPRTVGKHPDDGEDIIAGVGRFGPYVKHGKTYANIDASEDILAIGLNRAVTLIEEKKLNPGKGRRFGADPGKQLGEHPQKGGMIVAKNGRYGPYVSHNGVNANLPNDKTPETITLDEAVTLIDARAESGSGSSARRKRPGSRRTCQEGTRSEGGLPQKPYRPSYKRSARPRARPRLPANQRSPRPPNNTWRAQRGRRQPWPGQSPGLVRTAWAPPIAMSRPTRLDSFTRCARPAQAGHDVVGLAPGQRCKPPHKPQISIRQRPQAQGHVIGQTSFQASPLPSKEGRNRLQYGAEARRDRLRGRSPALHHLKNDRRAELRARAARLGRRRGPHRVRAQETASPRLPAVGDASRRLLSPPRQRRRAHRHPANGMRMPTAGAENPYPCRVRHGPAKRPASATARCCASTRPARTASHPAASSRSSTAQGARARHLPAVARRRRTPGADRQEAARQGACDSAGATKDAEDGDLVAVSVGPHSRLGLPAARVEERLGSMKSERAVSLIAIHVARHPACFRSPREAEDHAAPPGRTFEGSEDWRKLPLVTIDPVDAKDHDDAVHACSDPDPNNPRRPHRHRRHRRRRALRAAGLGARPRSGRSAAIRSISPTAWCRCCPSASPTTSARCDRTKTAPRSVAAW